MTGSTPYGLTEDNLQKLQSRHQSTLDSIKDLQNFERSMYSKLDTGVANKSLTQSEQEQVIQKINELSQMRSNLFQNLKDVYTYEAGNVSETRNDLVNQITTAGIIENELNNFIGCFITGTAAEITPVGNILDYNFTVCDLIKDLSFSYEKLVGK